MKKFQSELKYIFALFTSDASKDAVKNPSDCLTLMAQTENIWR